MTSSDAPRVGDSAGFDFADALPADARPAASYAEVEDALLSRWPESRLDPTLDRIADLLDVLGAPQHAYPVIHLTGTNGKTSTARMIETLVRAIGLRTGRFTSPHLISMTERIVVDGEPLADEDFVAAFNDIAPYLHVVDAQHPHPLSFFETVVAMAFAAFADAPVDVAVIEVGMGGTWDATNVADGAVAVITPIGIDHAQYLGDTIAAIAREKAGIIKPGSQVVCAAQQPEALDVIAARCADVGATLLLEGRDFGVRSRAVAVGGQQIEINGLRGQYSDLFLPLYGAHQASNAALALAAVEAFLGGTEPLGESAVADGFAEFSSPGRLEVVRRSPTIVLDAAHNPHGTQALVAGIEESFAFSPLIGVVGVMADKDVETVLQTLEPLLAHLVCTQNSTARAMPATELAELARGIFGHDRVSVTPDLVDAIEAAATLAEAGGVFGEGIGSGGVLITGSVVTVGEARALLVSSEASDPALGQHAAADDDLSEEF